jgi:chorismate mutase/prephenate dehydratase
MDGAGTRAELDAIDRDLVELLNRRARVWQRERSPGRRSAGRDHDEKLYWPELEAAVLEQAARESGGPLPVSSLLAIFREILAASRSLDRPLRIGFLGPVATFAYEAARRHFGEASTLVSCRTIADVFLETERRSVDYGVVPVENSTAGAVINTLDQFLETDLEVCAEIALPVSHNLLSNGKLDEIVRVYSHPQALAQCRRWLAENLPRATQIETPSTAGAAQMARDPATAAIATESAAALYDLPIVAPHIEDVTTNVTRFLVIGPHGSGWTGRDRTALVFSVEDRVGALCAALSTLAKQEINLSRIESRPSRRRLWEYVFFVDLDGHPDDANVALALGELRKSCSFVRVLGSWPR